MTTKTFDCVEMKRKGAARIYEATKDLSFDEQVEYWRRRSDEFRRQRRERQAQTEGSASSGREAE